MHKLLLLGAEGILSGIPSPTELLLTTPFFLIIYNGLKYRILPKL